MPTTTALSAYNIFNLGTIDADYSLPTSCITTSEPFRVVVQGFPIPGTRRSVSPCNPVTYGDCIPGGEKYDSTVMSAMSEPTRAFQMQYHSPASQCPEGWETVGVAEKSGRGAQGDASITGAFSATEFATGTSTSSIPWHNPKPNILLEAMGPGQTAVLCCPRYERFTYTPHATNPLTPRSNFTADPMGDCYQTLEIADYPETRCDINGGGLMSRGAFTYNGQRINGRGFSVTVTESEIEHETTTYRQTAWDKILPEIMARTTGYSYFPMMTLVNGEPEETRPVGGSGDDEDESSASEEPTASNTSNGEESSGTDETSSEETTDSAAGRGGRDAWGGGLGTLAVVWGVAAAAGAMWIVPL